MVTPQQTLRFALIAMLALCAGCIPAVEPPPSGTYLPTLAAAAGVASVGVDPGPAPTPEPEPNPGPRMCEACNGKGWVGDGTVRNKCEPCDGKGWFDAAGQAMDAPRLVALEAFEAELSQFREQINQRLEPQQPTEPEKSPHYADKFEADLLAAQMLGRPLLVFIWEPTDTERNERIKRACEGVEGIRERFAFAVCNISDQWDADTTVAEQFELPQGRTSLVIVSPSRQWVRVTSLEDLK